MKVWMYLRLVIGLLFRKRLYFILLTTIHRFKVDFSVFCSICLKSGNMKPLVAKWPCCFKDIFIYIYIYIYMVNELHVDTRPINDIIGLVSTLIGVIYIVTLYLILVKLLVPHYHPQSELEVSRNLTRMLSFRFCNTSVNSVTVLHICVKFRRF